MPSLLLSSYFSTSILALVTVDLEDIEDFENFARVNCGTNKPEVESPDIGFIKRSHFLKYRIALIS